MSCRPTPHLVPLVAAFAFVAACSGDLPTPPEPIAPAPILIPCEDPSCEPPPPPPSPTPWPYFAPAGDFTYRPPAHITPTYCFADLDPIVSAYRDYDKDWLADECELELAKAFAPLLWFAHGEPCPGGEPAWAVKYFNIPKVVRIAYLPAYYDDCGRPEFAFWGAGHAGDTEFIMVETIFDASTGWKVNQMWLSAHAGGGVEDRSAWVMPWEVRFELRGGVVNPHPSVWVSERKHANYRSKEVCRKPLIDFEECDYEGVRLRFPVQAWRNLGSRHQSIVDCVVSSGRFAGNGIRECFWSGRTVTKWILDRWVVMRIFGGWHPDNDLFGDQPAPYNDRLQSQYFERRCGRGLYQPEGLICLISSEWDPGPGPNPPPPPGSSPPPPPPPPSDCADPTQLICEEPMSVRELQ
jgi:hypothetical protein